MDRDVESFFCYKGLGKSTLPTGKQNIGNDSRVFGKSFVHLEELCRECKFGVG